MIGGPHGGEHQGVLINLPVVCRGHDNGAEFRGCLVAFVGFCELRSMGECPPLAVWAGSIDDAQSLAFKHDGTPAETHAYRSVIGPCRSEFSGVLYAV